MGHLSPKGKKKEWKERSIWRKNTEKFLNIVEEIDRLID